MIIRMETWRCGTLIEARLTKEKMDWKDITSTMLGEGEEKFGNVLRSSV